MYGYIYKTTNLINGKIYVGQHRAESFEPDVYIGSGSILIKAIKRYGRDNFKCELLETCDSEEELDCQEIYWIEKENARDSAVGYNITVGGIGGSHPVTDETKIKIAEWNKERTLVNDGTVCFKILKSELQEYLDLGYEWGPLPFTRSETFKEKVRASNTGKVAVRKGEHKTRVNRDKLSSFLEQGYQIGWKTAEEFKQPILKTAEGEGPCKWMFKELTSEYKLVPESSQPKFIEEGWIFKGRPKNCTPWNKGKKASPEIIKKLSDSHKGVSHSRDRVERHAQKLKGRIYVHKDITSKLVPLGEEDSYLAQGWTHGKAKRKN